MPTLVKTYKTLPEAETARNALLSAGVPAPSVRLEAQGDEAGAMAGNFVNGDFEPGDATGAYENKFQNVEMGGVFILTVDIQDTGMQARAAGIMGTGDEQL